MQKTFLILVRTTSGLEKWFFEICKNYSDIGLSLNTRKCDVLIFNELDATRSDDTSIDPNGTEVKPCVNLNYLGLPIGKKSEENLAIDARKVWKLKSVVLMV